VINAYFLAGLAEGYGKVGQVEQALNVLAEALAIGKKSDNRFWEAEIHRLRGQLTLAAGRGEDEAETAFQQALRVARQQQARSLELRATVNLSRLWQKRGKIVEAHRLLAEIYHWFSEGFDTIDLKQARALLDELQVAAPHA
jgi:predicted ATPase